MTLIARLLVHDVGEAAPLTLMFPLTKGIEHFHLGEELPAKPVLHSLNAPHTDALRIVEAVRAACVVYKRGGRHDQSRRCLQREHRGGLTIIAVPLALLLGWCEDLLAHVLENEAWDGLVTCRAGWRDQARWR